MKGTGWVPDPEPTVLSRASSALRSSRALLGAASRPPEGGIEREPWILDQGNSNSCTGHAVAQAIWLLTGEKVSPWFPWLFSRARDKGGVRYRKDGSVDVDNVGVSSFALRTTLAKHGACPYDLWRPGVEGFAWDALPPPDVRQQAQRYNLELAPIYERGEFAVQCVLDALDRKKPVCLVVVADTAFRKPVNGIVGDVKIGESMAPRHLVAVDHYRTVQSIDGPRLQFRDLNSWGDDYSLDGRSWLDESRIRYAPGLSVAVRVS